VFNYFAGEDGRSVVISGRHTVLLIGEALREDQTAALEHLLEGASFEEALARLQDPSGIGLTHFALLAMREGAIGEYAVAAGGRGGAMVWRGSAPSGGTPVEVGLVPAADLDPEAGHGFDPQLGTELGSELTSELTAEIEPLSETANQTNPFDLLFERTQFYGVEGAAVRAEEAEEHAPASALTHPDRFDIMLPDGTREAVDHPVLIGRRPEVPHDLDPRLFRLITIADRRSGLSRMHARFDPVERGIMVTDLGSTNGTAIIDPEGQVMNLPPHTPRLVLPGGRIVLASITLELDERPRG